MLEAKPTDLRSARRHRRIGVFSLAALCALAVIRFSVLLLGALAPTLTSLSPASGPVGTPVTITGANFVTGTQVGKIAWFGPFQPGVAPNNLVIGQPNGFWGGAPVYTADGGGSFIGTDDNYVLIPDGGGGGVYDWTSGEWSVQVDFTFPAVPVFPAGGTMVLASKGSFALGNGWEVEVNNVVSQGKYQIELESNHGINSYTLNTAYMIVPGQFHRTLFTCDAGGTGIWYVNGVASGVQPCAAPASGSTNMFLGRYSAGTGYAPGFPISGLQVWRRALTAAEAVESTTTTPVLNTVTFNGTPAKPTLWTATSIVAPVPAGATAGNVVVSVAGQASNGLPFGLPPAISTVLPASGAVGVPITITGTSFGATQGTSTVTFNGTPALPTTWSATSIVVPVPAGATSGNVVVTVGGIASNAVAFAVVVAPAITSLSPALGPIGTPVTITGTDFGATRGSSTVTFNGVAATPTSWSATSIVVPVPAGTTSGNVVVTVGGLASNGVPFTAPPVVTSLTPATGLIGSSVTIAGTGFGATIGTSTVMFNGILAVPTVWSATSIVVSVPVGATTGNVVVNVSGLASNSVVFTVSPTITGISPAAGGIGDTVTLTGVSFGATQGTSTVTFNGTTATPTTWSATSIVVPVPSGATSGNVVVRVGGVASNGVAFTVTPPTITGVSPASGQVGTSVTVTGTGFGAAGAPAPASIAIDATVFADRAAANTTVAVAGLSTTATNELLLAFVSADNVNAAATTVTGVSGGGLTWVLVARTNVQRGTAEIWRAFSAATLSNVSITATLSQGVTSSMTVMSFTGVDASGTNGSGAIGATASGNAAAGAPTATLTTTRANSWVFGVGTDWDNATARTLGPGQVMVHQYFSPVGDTYWVQRTTAATPVSGTAVTINDTAPAGDRYDITIAEILPGTGTSRVTFNGTPATPTSWSATSIVAPVPAGATTGNVVITAGGQVSNGMNFVVLPPTPAITNVTPTSGAAGTPITITGTNFGATKGTSTVSFNGVLATPTTWSATSILVPVPAGATSGNIIVTVNSQASNAFAFLIGPGITSLTPAVGPDGTPVTIAGGGFGATQGASTVTFNGALATPTSWTSSSIVVPAPVGVTTGNVVVTVGGQPSNGVNFIVPPSIATVTPAGAAVGAAITIAGANFGATKGTSTVTFNGTLATPTTWSATSIAVPVPAGATSGNVVVTVSGQPSNAVPFTVAPALTSLTPPSGPEGSSVTIAGTNFGALIGTSTVTFNGITGTPTNWSATSITVPVPAGADSGSVVVTVGGLPSNGLPFTVTPGLTSVTPGFGAVGAVVTLTGTNFGASQGTSTVRFNGTLAAPTGWTDTSILVPVPAGATTGNVVVTVGGISSNGVSFALAPAITAASPGIGIVGTSVTLTGLNFGATVGTSTVTFNGMPATPTSWSATSVVVPVPAAATTGNVAITVATQASNGVPFTVKPNIATLTPVSGPVGTSVTIAGTTFGTTQGASTVTFNGAAALPTSWSATSIVVPVPAAATTGNVVVTVGGQASNAVAFAVAPSLTTAAPTLGAVGTSITLTGTKFGATQGTSTVSFNGTLASPTGWTDTSITVPVPAGATTGTVVVTVNALASNGVAFTVGPTITSLTPAVGSSGSSVTIAGRNFGATVGTSTVTFNGTPATSTSWSATSIVVTAPAGLTTGNVVVTVGGLPSNGMLFTVGPSITSLTPAAGAVGASVTIAGANFGAAIGTSTVTFNGTLATPTTWSATSIAVPVPTGSTTGNVVVTVGGLASNGSNFTVAPVVNTLLPALGPVGTSVTISGANFGAAIGTSTVTFNGTAATPTSWSATSIVVPVPAGAVTGNVIVTVGGQGSAPRAFTVTPAITSATPATAPVGTVVTIAGTTFGATKGTSTVTFNGTLGTPTTWSATSIVVPVPAGATTGNVVVTVGGQASNGVAVAVPPSIATLTPPSGGIGAAVTIAGNTFGASIGTSTVTFNGTPATPTTWSATSIVVPAPAGATTGNVVVTVGGLASNGVVFTVTGPSITTLTPAQGAVGAAVTIAGAGFGATQGTSTVTFNGTVAPVTTWTSTSIVVPVPVGATTGNVVVTVTGQASNPKAFTVSPRITTVAPLSGIVGTAVTLTGANFGATVGTSTVTVNGVLATPTTWSATSIVVPVPAAAPIGVGGIVVTVGTLASNNAAFTVTAPPPVISTLSPTAGTAGTPVTITGVNLGTAGTVWFNGAAATTTSWSPTSIHATVPGGVATGNVAVVVGGQISNGVNFTVNGSGPVIASLSPQSGPAGTVVTVTGSNFASNLQIGKTGEWGPFAQGVAPTNMVAGGPDGTFVGSPTFTADGGGAFVATDSNYLVIPNGSLYEWTAGPWSAQVDFVFPAVPVWPAGGKSIMLVSNGSFAKGTGWEAQINPTAFQGKYMIELESNHGVGSYTLVRAYQLLPGAFHKALFTCDSAGNGTWYVNGSAWQTQSCTPAAIASTGLFIGRYSDGAGNTASLPISHVQVWSRALSSAEAVLSTTTASSSSPSITFNGTPAVPSAWSATTIQTTVPAGATSGNVVVGVGGQSSNGVPFTTP